MLIERVPYSVIDGIAWSVTETWLVYAVIVFMVIFFIRKVPLYMHGAQIAFVMLLLISTYKVNYISKQNKLIVYDINKNSAVDFISGNTNYLFTDNKLINDENSIRFNVLQNWYWMGAVNNKFVDIYSKERLEENDIVKCANENYLLFQNKRIGIVGDISQQLNGSYSKSKIMLDLLILKYNKQIDLDKLLNNYEVSQIVLDSTWPRWKVSKVKEALVAQKINVHAVSTDKAFVWEL
jgi:hypothetical protein